MKNEMKAIRHAAVLCAMLLTVSPAIAATYTLNDLVNNGTSFTSDDGKLTFHDFDITRLKKLDGNLSNYTVTTTATGFQLSSSAFTASSGGMKKLDLSYTVTGSGVITTAAMAMDATASSGRVKVEKDIEDATPGSDQGTFLLTLLQKNRSLLTDSDAFSPGSTEFHVEESIRIKRDSALNWVRNTYNDPVAEPTELALLVTGLSGLVWMGRRRAIR
jgi:hypothetical protein